MMHWRNGRISQKRPRGVFISMAALRVLPVSGIPTSEKLASGSNAWSLWTRPKARYEPGLNFSKLFLKIPAWRSHKRPARVAADGWLVAVQAKRKLFSVYVVATTELATGYCNINYTQRLSYGAPLGQVVARPLGERVMDAHGSADILLFDGFRFDRRYGGCLFRLDEAGVAEPVPLCGRGLALLGLLLERMESWCRKTRS
jgi:hypothetical protein